MDQRVSLITLGVRDVAASRRFYERLGWKAAAASEAGVAFFQAGGIVLSLFGRAALAEDARLPDGPPGFGGITLALNQRSKADVDRAIDEARAAGATILKPAADTFWGGYSGYFADPDGHPWEVAWNPYFPLDAEGIVRLPG